MPPALFQKMQRCRRSLPIMLALLNLFAGFSFPGNHACTGVRTCASVCCQGDDDRPLQLSPASAEAASCCVDADIESSKSVTLSPSARLSAPVDSLTGCAGFASVFPNESVPLMRSHPYPPGKQPPLFLRMHSFRC